MKCCNNNICDWDCVTETRRRDAAASSGTRGEMDCGTSGVGILYFSLQILIKVSVVHKKLYKIASTSTKKNCRTHINRIEKRKSATIQNIFVRNSWKISPPVRTQLGAQGPGWCGDLVRGVAALSVSLRYYDVTATSHLHHPQSHAIASNHGRGGHHGAVQNGIDNHTIDTKRLNTSEADLCLESAS